MKKKSKESCDSQEMDDALFDLVEGRIKSFRIYLNKDHSLFIEFSHCDGSVIYLRIYGVASLADDTSEELDSLKTMGFDVISGDKFIGYTFSIAGFRDAILIKQFLAKVLFDIIGYYQIEKPVTLERFLQE